MKLCKIKVYEILLQLFSQKKKFKPTTRDKAKDTVRLSCILNTYFILVIEEEATERMKIN